MALTITQQPDQLNAAYTNLLYVVSSSNVNLPQYQYVMDVVSGSQVLSRIRQYPNPNAVAVFDPHKIISDYLDYQNVDFSNVTSLSNIITNGSGFNATKQAKDFQVRFGEEYGTSPSSSVTLYNGNGGVGSPAVTGSNTPLHIFPGQINVNDPLQAITDVGFNFFTGSYPDGTVYNYNKFFTSQPNFGSALPGNDTQIKISYDDNAFVQFLYSGSLGDTVTITSNGLNSSGGATIAGSTYSSIPVNGLLTIPISPRQVGISEASWNSSCFGLRVRVSSSGKFTEDIYLTKDDENCNYDRVTINFINRLGCWDYFGFTLPTRQNTNVRRETYTQPFVDWSTSRDNNPNRAYFNPRTGGKTPYSTSLNKRITVTTPYLSQEIAHHVEQIFDSPLVRLKTIDGNGYNPNMVVVTDNSFVRNTNVRGQKLFQYTFNFEYSNNPVGR